jgi:hypothetical protein
LLEKKLFSLDEGRLQQEEDDYDKKCFSNDCGIHNYHARLPELRVQLGAGNPGTAPGDTASGIIDIAINQS